MKRTLYILSFLLLAHSAHAQGFIWAQRFSASGATTRDATLVGWWKLNAGAGTNCEDSAGASTGYFVGSPSWATNGYGNYALSFVSGSAVSIPNNSGAINLGISNSTVMGWIKSAGAGSGNEFILGSANSGANRWVLYTAAGKPSIYVAPNSGYQQLQYSTSINGSGFHHVCGVLSNKCPVALYVDGVLRASQTVQTMIGYIEGSGFVFIGDGTSYVHGMLDDARIYQRALSSNEVFSVFQTGPQ